MALRTSLRRAVRSTVWSASFLFLIPFLIAAWGLLNPVLVKDINPNGDSFPEFMTPIGDSVYFYADTGQAKQLFVANQQGATKLTSLADGINYIDHLDFPHPIIAGSADGPVYFLVCPTLGCAAYGIWRTDGTPEGTRPVLPNPDIDGFAAAGSGFYALAFDGSSGMGVWHSDGSGAGTKLVQGGFAYNAAAVYDVGVLENVFYFVVLRVEQNRYELWRADTTGAAMLGPVTFNTSVNAAVYQNALYFAGENGAVWRVSPGGAPVLWQDGSVFHGSIAYMYVIGDRLYLIDWDMSSEPYEGTLWRYDGAADKLDEIGTYSKIDDIAGMGDSAYFSVQQNADPPLGGSLLLRLPLTATQPMPVSSNFTLGGHHSIIQIEAGGDLLYMTVFTSLGAELWVSDGSEEGTRRVGSQIDSFEQWGSSTCPCLAVAGGQLYFDRQDTVTGVEPWRLERINLNKRLHLPHLAQ